MDETFAMVLPHDGKDGFYKGNGSEKIRLEELVHFFWNAFFHGSAVAIAGVIDEDVDGAKALQAFFYGIFDVFFLRNVKGQGKGLLWIGIHQVFQGFDAARRHNHLVPAFKDGFRKAPSKAGGTACNKPSLHSGIVSFSCKRQQSNCSHCLFISFNYSSKSVFDAAAS